MKRILKNIEFKFEFFVGYILTNPKNLPRYHKYMYEKWGDLYCTKDEYDNYVNGLKENN